MTKSVLILGASGKIGRHAGGLGLHFIRCLKDGDIAEQLDLGAREREMLRGLLQTGFSVRDDPLPTPGSATRLRFPSRLHRP